MGRATRIVDYVGRRYKPTFDERQRCLDYLSVLDITQGGPLEKARRVAAREKAAAETGEASYERAAAGRSALTQDQRAYLQLIERVTLAGQQTRRMGVIYDLTDSEAAVLLRWEPARATTCRRELCGRSESPAWIKERPLVRRGLRRRCNVSGQTAVAWKAALYAASDAAALR